MERQVRTEFDEIADSLTEEEKNARLDIKYQTTSGKHMIIELKRANRQIGVDVLIGQIRKYRNAIIKLLETNGLQHQSFEFVCIVGKEGLTDWKETDGHEMVDKALEPWKARVITYQELLTRAYASYSEFMNQGEKFGRLTRFLKAIDES
uniref:PD-(D/E)XK nuclease superfamily protein n=1 Tax=Candidatus Kentrum eta TaxID=2126337 RepID=A0A450VDE0_9GAMM|nr:MAG: hypothetical protein BECKH772B_GA0070898_102902 [Candidatus Kentron sp. H]VFK02784.1 MAG: hypothetical protein BECKH772A_GA0070896_102862 [Candidatus Kentron sp. H]VFK05607.1 MAG: hypothetical protein BECKH772C_GA0070978_102862 [Candidatus Kentron sp. H]